MNVFVVLMVAVYWMFAIGICIVAFIAGKRGLYIQELQQKLSEAEAKLSKLSSSQLESKSHQSHP